MRSNDMKPRLPDRWRTTAFDSLLDSLSGGVSLTGEDRERVNGEPGILTLAAITNGHFQPRHHKAVAASQIPFLGPSVSARGRNGVRGEWHEVKSECSPGLVLEAVYGGEIGVRGIARR